MSHGRGISQRLKRERRLLGTNYYHSKAPFRIPSPTPHHPTSLFSAFLRNKYEINMPYQLGIFQFLTLGALMEHPNSSTSTTHQIRQCLHLQEDPQNPVTWERWAFCLISNRAPSSSSSSNSGPSWCSSILALRSVNYLVCGEKILSWFLLLPVVCRRIDVRPFTASKNQFSWYIEFKFLQVYLRSDIDLISRFHIETLWGKGSAMFPVAAQYISINSF